MKTAQALVTLGFGSALTLAAPLLEEASAGIARRQPSPISGLDRRGDDWDWDDRFDGYLSDFGDRLEDSFDFDRRDLSASKLGTRSGPDEPLSSDFPKNSYPAGRDYDDVYSPMPPYPPASWTPRHPASPIITKLEQDKNDCNCACEHDDKATTKIQARSSKCPKTGKDKCYCPNPKPPMPAPKPGSSKPDNKSKPAPTKKNPARDLYTGEKRYVLNIDRPMHARIAQPSIQGLGKKYDLQA